MSSREGQVSKGPRQRSVTHRGSSVSAGEQGPDHPLHEGCPCSPEEFVPQDIGLWQTTEWTGGRNLWAQ